MSAPNLDYTVLLGIHASSSGSPWVVGQFSHDSATLVPTTHRSIYRKLYARIYYSGNLALKDGPTGMRLSV